jgi:hypothetical protein
MRGEVKISHEPIIGQQAAIFSLSPPLRGERVGVRGSIHESPCPWRAPYLAPHPEPRFALLRPLPAKERGEVKRSEDS